MLRLSSNVGMRFTDLSPVSTCQSDLGERGTWLSALRVLYINTYRVEGGFRSSKLDVKVRRPAEKTMLVCGRSYCAEQTLLPGSFILLGEGQFCDLTIAGVDLDCNNIANWLCFSAALVG